MPKIIENVREQLLNEAKKQISENGYGKTTVRSVANACGLGVGTVYNYFKSKDMLIASFMAEEWNEHLKIMKKQDASDTKALLRIIFSCLNNFILSNKSLFTDSDAAKVFATVFNERHKQLRNQLVEIILPVCIHSTVENKTFLAEYIAESLLVWTVAGKAFDEQYEIICRLLK